VSRASMVWSSATRAVRLPAAEYEAAWRRINSLTQTLKPVCCYGLRGQCNSVSTCGFSHDYSLVTRAGCQFGSSCRHGHGWKECDNWYPTSDSAKSVSRRSDCVSTLLDGGASCIECKGLQFDDTDPLWDEATAGLRDEFEDIGDGNITGAVRDRLASAGEYRMVDEASSDEWVCVLGSKLCPRLEAAEDAFAGRRREMLGDDLREAQEFWRDVVGTMSSWTPSRFSHELSDAKTCLQRRLNEAGMALRTCFDCALAPAFEEALPRPSVLENFTQLLSDARVAVEGVRRSADSFGNLQRQLSSAAWSGSSEWGNNHSGWEGGWSNWHTARDPDPELAGSGTTELLEVRRCLDRCLHLVYCLRRASKKHYEGVGAVEPTGDSCQPGQERLVRGLQAEAELSLNGQHATLERFDEEQRLWQVKLNGSGTKLLLPAENLFDARDLAPSARSVLDIAQEAAALGDYVLIHHVVHWYGSDVPARS